MWLPFSSNYPNSYKKNIPSALARRVRTIVENNEANKKNLEIRIMNLSKFQYPKQLSVVTKKL